MQESALKHSLINDHPVVHINGKTKYVSRLVAETFIPNDNNLTDVIHLDGDITNNEVHNLKWGTHSESQKNSISSLSRFNGLDNSPKKIEDGANGREYLSIRSCSKNTNVPAPIIRKMIKENIRFRLI